MRSNLRRRAGVSVVALATAFGAASCGSVPATSSQTTIRVGATNFVTLPPTLSTVTPVTSATAQAGAVIEGESTYVVEANDYPSTVARKFGVSYEEFMALNGFVLDENGYLPGWGPGFQVRIPAGATMPGSAAAPATATTLAPTAGAAETTLAPATTAEVCTSDEPYTIAAGDVPLAVATQFNTTVDDLNRANGGTPGFAAFVVGTVIKIPVEC